MGGGIRWTPEQLDAHIKRVNDSMARQGRIKTHRISDRAPTPKASEDLLELARTLRCEAKSERLGRPKLGPSELELAFAKQMSDAGLPNPVREFAFTDKRDWRLDYAWPEYKLAVEVQGMVHRIKKRFLNDVEKLANAQILGWTVLLIAGQDIRAPRGVSWLETLLQQRGWKR